MRVYYVLVRVHHQSRGVRLLRPPEGVVTLLCRLGATKTARERARRGARRHQLSRHALGRVEPLGQAFVQRFELGRRSCERVHWPSHRVYAARGTLQRPLVQRRRDGHLNRQRCAVRAGAGVFVAFCISF